MKNANSIRNPGRWDKEARVRDEAGLADQDEQEILEIEMPKAKPVD